MEYQFTINQIASRCKVSITSINNLKRKNQDFINKNSMRRQHKIYYNQAAMDFFLSYYATDNDTDKKMPYETIDIDTAEERAENSPLESQQTEEQYKSQLDTLKREIGALEAEIESLRKQLDASESERKELIRQNGALILTLQQEKQEKLLFLPSPKKSFSDRVKELFHK